MQELVDKENYGYFSGRNALRPCNGGWKPADWKVEQDWMFTTHGLGHGIATTLLALTEPGDAVVTFTPVYHEFENKITKAGRTNTQLPLVKDAAGLYRMDFDAYEALMTQRTPDADFHPAQPGGPCVGAGRLDAMADQRHDCC